MQIQKPHPIIMPGCGFLFLYSLLFTLYSLLFILYTLYFILYSLFLTPPLQFDFLTTNVAFLLFLLKSFFKSCSHYMTGM